MKNEYLTCPVCKLVVPRKTKSQKVCSDKCRVYRLRGKKLPPRNWTREELETMSPVLRNYVEIRQPEADSADTAE